MQAANALALGTSPIVRSLVDPEGGMQAVRNLDNVSFADWFRSHGGSQGSIERMWDPIGALQQTFTCNGVHTEALSAFVAHNRTLLACGGWIVADRRRRQLLASYFLGCWLCADFSQ